MHRFLPLCILGVAFGWAHSAEPALPVTEPAGWAKTLGISSPDALVRVSLKPLVEGRRQTLDVTLRNDTQSKFTGLSAKGACSCLGVDKISSDVFGPGDTLTITVIINPPRDSLADSVKLVGKDEASGLQRDVAICSIAFSAICYPPLRPSSTYISLGRANTEPVKLAILPADENVKLGDPPQVRLDSKYVEIQKIEPQDGHWSLTLAVKQGVVLPDEDFSGVLLAPFRYGDSQEMLMEEVVRFTNNRRVEVFPTRVRLKTSASPGRSHASYTGLVVLKDFTGKTVSDSEILSALEVMLVSKLDGQIVMIDSKVASQSVRVGKSNSYRTHLHAKVFRGLRHDDEYYLVAYHGSDEVDCSLPWEQFVEQYTVVDVDLE